MKYLYLKFLLILLFLVSGCAPQKFTVNTVGYSSWQDGDMIVRRKAILLDTETGEAWGLAYHRDNQTRDGYGWEKIPHNPNQESCSGVEQK